MKKQFLQSLHIKDVFIKRSPSAPSVNKKTFSLSHFANLFFPFVFVKIGSRILNYFARYAWLNTSLKCFPGLLNICLILSQERSILHEYEKEKDSSLLTDPLGDRNTTFTLQYSVQWL